MPFTQSHFFLTAQTVHARDPKLCMVGLQGTRLQAIFEFRPVSRDMLVVSVGPSIRQLVHKTTKGCIISFPNWFNPSVYCLINILFRFLAFTE